MDKDLQIFANSFARMNGYGKATDIIFEDISSPKIADTTRYGYRKISDGQYVPHRYRVNFGWKNTFYQKAKCTVALPNFFKGTPMSYSDSTPLMSSKDRQEYTDSVFHPKPEEIEIKGGITLTETQQERLNNFVASDDLWKQLGRSSGCASSRNNYHSTYAERISGKIIVYRVEGDPRNYYNIIKKKYNGHQ